MLDHDVAWLLAQCDTADKRVLVLSRGDGRGIPMLVHDGNIDLVLGELSIGRLGVRRHVLVGNFDHISRSDWESAFSLLRGALGSKGIVFLLGIVEGEALAAALGSERLRSEFRVLPHGPAYARRICRLGADLEAYLASLPSGRRQDLKRSLRRFEREFSGRCNYALYRTPEEVGNFLAIVEPVSRRTYQAQLRGLGITAEGHVGHLAIEGARRGYVRCYLLTVDGEPVAWRIGYLYGDTFFSQHVGYDPAYESWHPGVVMHLHTVGDLSRQGSVRFLDMLYGDNAFKRKAANLERREQNYYLFSRSLRGTVGYGLLAAVNRASEWIGGMLEHYGLKDRIKRVLRRVSREG